MITKTVYLYDTNGIYTESYVANQSPLESGKFIEPVNSTEIEPPAISANQAAVFSNGTWYVEPDYRGQTWYNQTTGVPTEITSVGTPASNLGQNIPSSIALSQATTNQIIGLSSSYKTALAAGVSFTTAGGVTKTFQTDPASISNMQSIAASLANGWTLPAGFYWVSSDNTQVPFTSADLAGLIKAATANGWALFQHLQTQKAAVLAATTVAAVEAIVW